MGMKMSMEEFWEMGYTWFARKYEIEYKYPFTNRPAKIPENVVKKYSV